MARTKSGGLNKILNFIGLVDDEEPRDTYSDEYEDYRDDRSRTYVPRRESRSVRNENAPAPRRRVSDYEPTRPTPTRRSEMRNDQPRRTVGSYASSRSASRYDQSRASRFDSNARYESGSRFDASSAPAAEPQREESRERRHSGSAYRTVMYNVTKLNDCCDVIDSLLLNNTVLMNMESLDNETMQRCIDTLSGAVFALHATIKKVSERTYLAAPMDIQVDEVFNERA